jgi:hypothetical protein
LHEKLAFTQKFLAPNISIHHGLELNFQPPMTPGPSDNMPPNIHPFETTLSNHTQQVGTQGHENHPSVEDPTPEPASISSLFDQTFDDWIQTPPETPQHDFMPFTIPSDSTNQRNPCSSLEALPFVGNQPQATSTGDCMRDHDTEDRIGSGNNSDISNPSHTPRPAKRVIKSGSRKSIKGKSVQKIGNKSALMLVHLAGPDSSPLDEAESMRVDLLKSLMSKAGQSFKDQTLRTIYEIGDRIVNDTAVVLNNWSEWCSREFQLPDVLLPACHDLSEVEISVAAYRFLLETHNGFHRRLVHRRLAHVLLQIFIPELEEKIATKGARGQLTFKGRQPITIAHDSIIEKVGALVRDTEKCNRGHLVDCRSYGKRWWRLGSGIGIVAILAGSQDLAKQMQVRTAPNDELDAYIISGRAVRSQMVPWSS